jgi:hypothetical protein
MSASSLMNHSNPTFFPDPIPIDRGLSQLAAHLYVRVVVYSLNTMDTMKFKQQRFAHQSTPCKIRSSFLASSLTSPHISYNPLFRFGGPRSMGTRWRHLRYISAHGGAQKTESLEAPSSKPSGDLIGPKRASRLKAVESPFHAVDRNAYDLDVRHYQVCNCVRDQYLSSVCHPMIPGTMTPMPVPSWIHGMQ